MVALRRLKAGTKVAVYPFEGVPFEEPAADIIVDKHDVLALLKKLDKDSRGNSASQIIGHLEKEASCL